MDLKQIPFLDLTVSDENEFDIHINSLKDILQNGPLISGEPVRKFEQKISSYCNRKYAIAVNSGTSALILAMKSLGIGQGDEVIVPCLSWIASANAIALTGAKPVFADIEDDLNLSPASVRRLITNKVKAVLAVDFTGRPVQIDKIEEIAKEHEIPIIEDAAQAFGASLNSKKCGSFGHISCFSLNPVKVFGALGEAGVILTDDAQTAGYLDHLRNSGLKNRKELLEPSFNARMDTIQASFLLNRMSEIENKLRARRSNARFYFRNLTNKVSTPNFPPCIEHSFYTFTIQTSKRDDLRSYLEENGVETQIQHPILMCDQPAYSDSRKETSKASKIVKRILSLPIHEKLDAEDLLYVTKTINHFFGENL